MSYVLRFTFHVKLFLVFTAVFLLAACQPESIPLVMPTLAQAVTLSSEATAVSQPSTAISTLAAPAIPNNPPSTSPPPTFTPQPPMPTPTSTPTPCGQSGRIETGTFPSVQAGEMRYRIYLPPCYGEDGRTYPALYMFGGNAHADDGWDKYGLDEATEAGIHAAQYPPLIIVMPDGGYYANNTSGGPQSYEGIIINDLIPFIEKTYCVWAEPAGRAIGGVSRGGYWSLEIAFRQPEMFVSVGGHSAALIDRGDRPDANPQYTGIDNDLGDLRIYMDIGNEDWLLPNYLRLHEDMLAKNPPVAHEWVLGEGMHEDAYWMARLNDYLTWYVEPWPFDRAQYPVCTLPAADDGE